MREFFIFLHLWEHFSFSLDRNAFVKFFSVVMLRFYVLFLYVNSARSSRRWCKKAMILILGTFFLFRFTRAHLLGCLQLPFAFHAIIKWHSFSAAFNWNSNERWRAITTEIRAVRTIPRDRVNRAQLAKEVLSSVIYKSHHLNGSAWGFSGLKTTSLPLTWSTFTNFVVGLKLVLYYPGGNASYWFIFTSGFRVLDVKSRHN